MIKHSPIKVCGKSVANLPANSDDLNRTLFEAMRNGDPAARERLILGNLRLVLLSLHRHVWSDDDPQDLFQVGVLGLIKAVDGFNPDYGNAFSTYAVPMIVGETRRYLRDNSPIRISRSVRDLANHARSLMDDLRKKTGRDPTVKELANILEVPEPQVQNALDAVKSIVSIQSSIFNEDTDLVLEDVLKDESEAEDSWIENIALQEALNRLDDLSRRVVRLRFCLNKTQSQVARILGCSQPQVHRLEKRALVRLKKYMGD